MNFQKLTPIDDAKIDGYDEALEYVFDHDDIRNVAVSGSYSAGKSSILETHKKKHNDKKYIHISLARFEETPNAPSDTESKENILEGKILNQLIQQIDPKQIPQTHFRVKRPHAFYKKGLFAFGCVLFILLIFYLIYFSGWVNFVNGLADGWAKSTIVFLLANQVSRLIGLILAVVLAVLGIYTIINIQLNKGLFKKISVQGNEIEIFSEDEESFFDKYLNEVLYLFEKADADVIVFEDIDRYNSVEIFQRLREINTLVNRKLAGRKQSKIKELIRKLSKRKQINTIRFFYLLRDDMFVSKDRTKFFDFIIPVVPVIDGSNSYDQMLQMFATGSEDNRFNPKFLQDVSLYIDDMRILKNICNEYQIYRRRIVNTEQDNNKMLAMVIYKNIFPRDFSDLQLNRGFVYKVFNYKDTYIRNEEIRVDNRIADHKGEIERLNSEILKDKTEIERLYAYSDYQKYRSSTYGLKEEYAKEKKERINDIEDRLSGKVNELQDQIEALQTEKAALYDKKLSEIITRENLDEIFSAEVPDWDVEADKEKKEEIEKGYQLVVYNDYFDLLKYLIRNGYIDETYPDYMSYFYEHSLSKADKVFLRSITDQKAKDYQYNLTDPQKVVERLRKVDFCSEEIRNYDLLEYLLKKYDVKHIYIQNFIHCLRDTEALDFVFGYMDRSKEQKAFIKALCTYWNGVFDAVVAAPEYSDSQRHRIALLIIYNAEDMLPSVNENDELAEYINHNADFLNIEDPDVDTIINAFKVLDVCFADLNFVDANPELLDAVYRHRMYELNEVMTGHILEHWYHIERSDDYQHKNLSLIRTQPDSELYQYVESEMEKYIEQYVGSCGEDIRDDEESIAWVVNHDGVSDESKEEYLNCLSAKIETLEMIGELRWQSILLSMDLAVCSMANIMEYFFFNENTIDETLSDFINRNEIVSDINCDFSAYESSQCSAAFNAIIKCDLINDRQYRILVDAMNMYYKSFSIVNVSDNKIRILIDLRVIRMSGRDVLLFMRKNYPNQVVCFIEQNIKEYCDIIDAETIDVEEAAALMNTRIRINYKLKILGCTDAPIPVSDKGYQGKLVLHILQHNFDEKDLPFILANYEKYSAECREVILQLLISRIETVIVEAYPLSFQLMMTVIDEQTFDSDRLFVLFSISVGGFDLSQTKMCLTQLGETEYLSVFDGKHPKFAYTAANKRILDAFLQKEWISSYVLEPDSKYRAYGKKRA